MKEICKGILENFSTSTAISRAAEGFREQIYNKTLQYPEHFTLSDRVKIIANDLDCKCQNCNGWVRYLTKIYCSRSCYSEYISFRKRKKIKNKLEVSVTQSHQKYKDKIKDTDYKECKICSYKAKDISHHLIKFHKMRSAEYKKIYNVEVKIPELIENVKGSSNPGYKHGGRLSKWSKKFIHGYNEEDHKKFSEKMSKFQKKNGNNCFRRDFYESDEEYTKFQTKNLEWFINKFGEDEGLRRYKKKTEKWLRSFKKLNFSMISQELFVEISKNLESLNNIRFASFDFKNNRIIPNHKGENFEAILNIGKSYCRPDFIDFSKGKIIEFDGEYWHSGSKANPVRERERDHKLINEGYEVLHVKEVDFKKNREEVLKQCLKFLNS